MHVNIFAAKAWEYDLTDQKGTCLFCHRRPDLLQTTNVPTAARDAMITAGRWDESNNF